MNSPKPHLLLIDDDPNTLASLSRAFRLAGYEATVCDSAVRALDLIRAERFDVIFSDVVMPGKDGISLLEDLKAAGVTTPVVMISGQATVETAVKATRLGAVDFLEKPLSTEKLLLTIENVLRLRHLEDENRDLRSRLGKHEMIWSGPAMERLMAQVKRVAASESRVAIQGETGTGKELIARTIHQKSARHAGPFVTLNCAAVPAELIESELFGHEKGSFTGAATRHIGKFEQAAGGTLFIASIFFQSPCRRCANAPKRFPRSPNIFPPRSRRKMAGGQNIFRRSLWRSCSAMRGRATCASCATWSSVCCCFPAGKQSPPRK